MYALAQENLELLSKRLWNLKKNYNWARSRGDSERAYQFEIQMKAITAEREHLIQHLSEKSLSALRGR
jgi:hypothetical protein